MELDRYRALVCAIETGSLSAAAEALQYTPSGVSRMVAALEEETGVPLLLREHSGVRPTKECEKLLPAIRDLLHAGESCAQLSAQLRGLDVGTVTVGTAYSAFYSPLARIISDFHARYGGIQVQLRGGYSTELITQLNAHQLDLCFISVREGGHDWLPIGYDELTAWVPVAHPMAWLPALPVAAFAKEPYIETYPDKDIDNARVFARCGITPNLKLLDGRGRSRPRHEQRAQWPRLVGRRAHPAARPAADRRDRRGDAAGPLPRRADVPRFFGTSPCGIPLGKILRFS